MGIRLWRGCGLLLAVACGEAGRVTDPVTPPATPPRLLSIQPVSGVIYPGDSLAFSAQLTESNGPSAVRWELSPPTFGSVSAAGWVKTPSCPQNWNGRLRATLVADSSVTAEVDVALPDPFGFRQPVSIYSVHDSASDAQSNLAAITGTVRVDIRVTNSGCFGLRRLRLVVNDPAGGSTPLPWLDVVQPAELPAFFGLYWNTKARAGSAAAFPNGRYTIVAEAMYSGENSSTFSALPAMVANP